MGMVHPVQEWRFPSLAAPEVFYPQPLFAFFQGVHRGRSWRSDKLDRAKAMSSTPLFDRYAPDDPTVTRHKGNPQSEAAHEAVRLAKRNQHRRILDELARVGSRGSTCQELSYRLGMAYTSISARLSELKRSGDVLENGEKRATSSYCMAAVVVLRQYAK